MEVAEALNASYNGTRGDSGSSASHDAAVADAEHGVTNAVQLAVLEAALARGHRGVTAAEMRDYTQEHHGRVSSALTKLHIAGKLVALEERRGHGGIYVTPDNVNGRPTRPYRRQTKKVDEVTVVVALLAHRPSGLGCTCGWRPTSGDASYVYHQAREIVEATS